MEKFMKFASAVVTSLMLLSGSASAKSFSLDPAHTGVGFRIRHLLTYVNGHFNKFEGRFETDDKTGALKYAEAKVSVDSIDTSNSKRDEHLRSPDFFDATKIPAMTFASDKFSVKKGGVGRMPGKLTIHGVTKPVVFNIEYFGETKGPDGKMTAGATGTAKINRKDFGLTWSKTLETGGVLVGDDVVIQLEIAGNE
jgi:polyisoprenoid-binding protein YceI